MKDVSLFSVADNVNIHRLTLKSAYIFLAFAAIGAALVAGIFPPPRADLSMSEVYD